MCKDITDGDPLDYPGYTTPEPLVLIVSKRTKIEDSF